MNEEEYHQLELERRQQTEEAIARAKAGTANEDDWRIIEYECGIFNVTIKGNSHGTYSERRQ